MPVSLDLSNRIAVLSNDNRRAHRLSIESIPNEIINLNDTTLDSFEVKKDLNQQPVITLYNKKGQSVIIRQCDQNDPNRKNTMQNLGVLLDSLGQEMDIQS